MCELLREKRLRGGQLETRFIIRNFQDETFKNASWVLVGKLKVYHWEIAIVELVR